MRRPFEFMRPLARPFRFREDDVPEECVPSVRGPECAVRHEGLVSLCRGFDIALRTPLSLYSMGPSSSLVFCGKRTFSRLPASGRKGREKEPRFSPAPVTPRKNATREGASARVSPRNGRRPAL